MNRQRRSSRRDHVPTSRRLGPVSSLIVDDKGQPGDHDYLAREAKARIEIDKQLVAAGWKVQSQDKLNLSAGPGVAVREFTLEKPHGRVDYLLFLNGQPAGVIEAKPEGTTLIEVEHQSGKYVEGLPGLDEAAGLPAAVHLRVHRRRDPVHQRLRPGCAQPPRVHVPPARDPDRVVAADHSPIRDLPTFRARLRAHAAARRAEAVGQAGAGDPRTWRSLCATTGRGR